MRAAVMMCVMLDIVTRRELRAGWRYCRGRVSDESVRMVEEQNMSPSRETPRCWRARACRADFFIRERYKLFQPELK